ncbi:E3 ubiquitin protein ligase DRIP2-like [Humulus lupulus]|uniref:E3 ubiquitin protein ligase DRIP2-like n=1 Tax=Humulus lupulus TaxID=3486 RepID=UPI002B41038D|nr:E3 ubiquitin protein ligase DRIP2-like [Humulus lupulus]
MMMRDKVVKLRAEKVSQCLTCLLCQKLLDDATTITECLHAFCRKCIVNKIRVEGYNTCPVCKIELGAAPLEKLRADHSLKELRDKLFPSKTKKGNNKEAHDDSHTMYSSVPVTAKEKGKSLSSLADAACRVSAVQPPITGLRRNPPRNSFIVRESAIPVREEYFKAKIPVNRKKGEGKHATGSSKQRVQSKSVENNAKILREKAAASKTKTNQANTQEATATNMPVLTDPITKVYKIQGKRSRARAHVKGSAATLSDSDKSRRTEEIVQQISSTTVAEGQHSVPVESKGSEPATKGQHSVAVESKGSEPAAARCFSPIWFSLIASHDQKGYPPLPQLSSRYLRLKDDTVTVSLVKKYIVKKLNLASESEVEILLKGEPLSSTIQLRCLMEIWSQAMSSEIIETSLGSSGEDVVMDLTYGRKAQS